MKKLFLLLLTSLLLYACASKQEKPRRIKEDGIDVVLNGLAPYREDEKAVSLSLKEEFAIDTEKDYLAIKGLTDIWHFDIDSEASVYILSYIIRDYAIFKFDKNGNFVAAFGPKGEGPDELQRPISLRINNRDEIFVIDSGKRKLLLFRKDGSLIQEIPFSEIGRKESALVSNVIDVVPLEDGNYLVQKMMEYDSFSEYEVQLPLVLCDSEFKETKELDRQKVPNFNTPVRVKGIFPIFTWGVSDGKIFVGDDEKGYAIRMYDLKGNLAREIRKKYKPVKIPAGHKRKVLELFKPYSEKIYFPRHWPAFRYLFADDQGRLFVMTFEQGKNPGEYIYDVFNADGILTARTSLGNYGYSEYIRDEMPLEAKAKNGRIYCTREKPSGFKELAVYKMIWE